MDPGTKLETDQGLARRFGVSPSVVREALSIFSRQGLVDRQVGRGTFVAVPLPTPSKPVAILCDLDLTQPHSSPREMIKRVQESKRLIEMRGGETMIYLGDHVPYGLPPSHLTCRQFLKDLEGEKLGAVLAVSAFPHDLWTRQVRNQKLPFVGFGLLHDNMVSYDFDAYVRLSLEALKARGRRKIAYLNGLGEWNLGGHDQERLNRVINIFQEANVEVREGWLFQEWHRTVAGSGWTAFREIWTSYAERPDGLIVGSPQLLPDIEKALRSLDLQAAKELDIVVPRAKSTVHPRNTPVISMNFDTSVMIAEAVDLLLQLRRGESPANTRRFVNAWKVSQPSPPSQEWSLYDPDIDQDEELFLPDCPSPIA